jgi:hypothetical protein
VKVFARLSIVSAVCLSALSLGCSDVQPTVGPQAASPSFDRSKAPGLDQACSDHPGRHLARRPNSPVALLCAFTLPTGSSPILNGTKAWVYHGRYYLTELKNASVYIFDVITHHFVNSVGGFVGSTGVAATSGPNAITFSDDGHAWVSDGISAVRVVDLHSNSIIATISTAIAACDNGTVHDCQRTNEITYDPEHRIVLVGNPAPLDTAAPHGGIDSYATFISAVPPYHVLGHISFPNSRNHEAPLWDPHTRRFLIAVSGRTVGTTIYQQYVGVVNPRTMVMEAQYPLDCHDLVGAAPGTLFGVNDPALGPRGHMVIPACGHAVVMDANTGAVLATFRQIGGGNETWYNPGDDRFYVTGIDSTATTPVNSLGVIDASRVSFLQGVAAVGATNPASSAENNETFAVVPANATTATACTAFGFQASGCILVFGHVPGPGDKGDGDDRD